MATYRARACPKCQYYVGYCLTKPVHARHEVSVKSFCLNCNYQFPVRAVICGRRNFPPRRRKPAPAGPAENSNDLHDSARWTTLSPPASNEALAQRAYYPRALRAIGQELEKRRFTTFNLKCSDDSYFVWSTEIIAPALVGDALTTQGRGGLQSGQDDPDDAETKMLLDRIVGFLFNAGDVKRLEHEGVENRRQKSAVSNGRRLSHLLRTVGEQVYRRNQRLLGIAWQDRQVSVVAESVRGRREITVLRTDNLYDLWVRMYLQRSH